MRIQQRSTIGRTIWKTVIAIFFLMAGGLGVFAQDDSPTPPGLAQEYYREGLFYGKQGKYVEAVFALEKAIELDPANADAYNALGVVSHRQKKSAQALEYYLLAVEADPGHAKARTNLALMYVEQQQPEKAVRQLEQALKARPDYRPAQKLLAKIGTQHDEQAAKERVRQEQEAQKKAPQPKSQPKVVTVKTAPAPTNPIFRSGTGLVLAGELDAAIQTYRRGLVKEPRSAEGYALLAMAYREKFRQTGEERWKQHEVKAFALALQYQPDSVSALLGLGELYYEQGQHVTALAYFEKALRVQPSHPAREQLRSILQSGLK